MKQNKKSKKIKFISYLKESKTSIFTLLLLFVLSILLGVVNADSLSNLLIPFLEELIKSTENLGPFAMIKFIFINNVLASLIGLLLGLFLGIFPIIITLTNGIILGFVLKKTVEIGGIIEVWRLFPHGIFEIPAVFISLGLGLKLGTDILNNYLRINKNNNLKKIIGISSLFLGLLSIGLIRVSTNSLVSSTKSAYLSSLLLLIIEILLLVPFIILFFIQNKEIRNYNIERLIASLKIFIIIIIPLLVIAAIIEGLLISFL